MQRLISKLNHRYVKIKNRIFFSETLHETLTCRLPVEALTYIISHFYHDSWSSASDEREMSQLSCGVRCFYLESFVFFERRYTDVFQTLLSQNHVFSVVTSVRFVVVVVKNNAKMMGTSTWCFPGCAKNSIENPKP